MDKKIFSFLFSTRLMAVLFLTFAIAMGVGTFIESKYNTDTARILIYNTWWFEAIMFIFMINFLGNIKRYQLLKKEGFDGFLMGEYFMKQANPAAAFETFVRSIKTDNNAD